MMEYFVHESSYVDEGAEVGKGTKIWHFSHILHGRRSVNTAISDKTFPSPGEQSSGITSRCRTTYRSMKGRSSRMMFFWGHHVS